MRTVVQTLGAVAVAIWLIPATGCSPTADPLAPVQGTIFFRNQPLRSGMIVFAPNEGRGGSGPLACSEIAADGTYRLRTGSRLGAAPGWHRVTIVALEEPTAGPSPDGFLIPRMLLPQKFRDPELSGLECEVQAGLANRFDFHIE
jgi:hypothetical protein